MRTSACLVLACISVAASRGSAQELRATLKAGVASSYVVRSEYSVVHPRYGVAVGGGLRLQLTSSLGFQAEAQYVEKGEPYLHLGYWEFPILLRAEIPFHVGGFSPALAGGIAPARLARCTLWSFPIGLVAAGATAGPVKAPCSLDVTDSDDFGLVAAIEFARPLPRGRLGLEVRYTHGTSDIASGYACCVLRNRSVAVALTYAISVLR